MKELLKVGEKKSSLRRFGCKECGKKFLTNRKTDYCFDCEKKMRLNRTLVGVIIAGIVITLLVCGCMETEEQKEPMQNNPLQNTTQGINTADSKHVSKNITIKVVKFEPNNPCQGCTNLGNYADETIKMHFPEDYKSGKITYETVNFQDTKNRDVVKKYSVVGSSLYITAIKDGKEEIIDANDMWNYVWDKEEYINTFKAKLEKIKNEN